MCVVKAVSCLMNDWRAGVETRSIGFTETYRICHEVWNVATAISHFPTTKLTNCASVGTGRFSREAQLQTLFDVVVGSVESKSSAARALQPFHQESGN